MKAVNVGNIAIGGRNPLVLIAGPCVIESREKCLTVADRLAQFAARQEVPLIFKASYDKANRTSHKSFRGPGLEQGLKILAEVKEKYCLSVLTDIHSVNEVAPAAEVADVLQIPAFLCRQTDLLIAAGETGKPVNVKKGQFLAPDDLGNVVAKIESSGNRKILVTERGTCFGYNNLVADMRSLPMLRNLGYPVVFDATHSVQRPGAAGDHSGGDSRWVPFLARAAVAAGCDAVFIETHDQPSRALSDKNNMLELSALAGLWKILRRIDETVG
jgi:2-dehydro-3-deoxyphosphooctonate aldolase (KDO 8-P synthase)